METTIRIIGQTIKELRSKRGLTLEEVAERSGCTPGFLSQVERNKAAPSITTLYSIAEALGVKITDFFPEGINTTKVMRHDHRENFHFQGSAIVYSLLSTKFPYGGLASFLLTMRPANQALPTDEFRAHMGEEFVYVLDGVLRLWIGDGFYDLYPGDTVYFKSTVKHRLENRSNQPVIALSLITPSLF
jgi:transcriptional regulator with XRE-family HTH domain